MTKFLQATCTLWWESRFMCKPCKPRAPNHR